jgi:2-polyprenyl-3-methyl-5-hydroxy-6-metoxy-1,4-benzoquinol methylase
MINNYNKNFSSDDFILYFMDKTNLWNLFYDELGKLNILKTMNWGYSINNHIKKISTYEIPKNFSKSDTNSLNLYYYLVKNAIKYSNIELKTNADIGCGKGGGINFINKCFNFEKSIGYDFSNEGLTQAKIDYSDKNIQFKHFDARKLQSCEGVDLITNVESFHCYGYNSNFFENCYNMLNNNGVLSMTDFIDIQKIQSLSEEASEYFDLLYLEDISENVIMSVNQKIRNNDTENGILKIKYKFPYIPESILNKFVQNFSGEENRINMVNNKTIYFLVIFKKKGNS